MTIECSQSVHSIVMGFILLRVLEFFVFRKMEMPETKNHLLCGWRQSVVQKNHLSVTIELFRHYCKKGKGDFMANKNYDLAHTKWMCKYHIVFTPKYRRKVIYNQLKVDIRDILKQLCCIQRSRNHRRAFNARSHSYASKHSAEDECVKFYGIFERAKSALMIFDRHANLKYKFGNRHFWSEGYYVSTVGLNEATIKKYIQDQEKNDIMQDKLGVKEYENPFKG